MKEFLVEITTTVPPGTDPAEVDRRRAAEAARARELAAAGHLFRLWRPAGELRSIGVWRADSEDELHEKVLGTLPLRPWMSVTVTALVSHPSDPSATAIANDPFARLPEVPRFTVTSTTVSDGDAWPAAQMSGLFGVPGGKDISPQLSWSGAPEGTKSYAVTVYDPDAPTGSGFWHWAVADIPAAVTQLPQGAGDPGPGLPEGAYQLPNDARAARYIGAAPPAGHGPHRYFVVVHALDVEQIGVPADATPAYLGFTMTTHILGRAVLTATAEIPSNR
jgi:muconolactone delta-isomerase